MRRIILCLVALAAAGTPARGQDAPAGEVTVTKVVRRVTDQTGSLSGEQLRVLESRLSAIEEATSNQIVVVLIPTLGGESLEETSLRIAEQSGVGKKAKNNGVLLLIAKNDRKLRVEVGYGLEGALPDALAATIIRNEIVPRFRSGDYYGGILAGIDAIDRATRNEYAADPARGERHVGMIPFVILVIIIIIFLSSMRRRRHTLFPGGVSGPFGGGYRGGGGFGGGMFGGGGGFSGGGGGFGGGGASGGW